jgi:hypothetical protein
VDPKTGTFVISFDSFDVSWLLDQVVKVPSSSQVSEYRLKTLKTLNGFP